MQSNNSPTLMQEKFSKGHEEQEVKQPSIVKFEQNVE